MEVPGSIPGVRKSPFLGVLGRHFLGFLYMLGHVGGHFRERLGSLFGRVGVTFSSFLGCLGKCLGVVWGCF